MKLGPFTLEELLGRGGMGEVWAARHAAGTRVALKIITGPAARDPHFRAGFRAEIQTVAELNHRGIVQVFDYGVADVPDQQGRVEVQTPWLAMEVAQHALAPDTITSWAQAVETLSQVLHALSHAHARGVVHRDLKPANVLHCGPRLKLADFGIAHLMHADIQQRSESAVVGTPLYMSPEQFKGHWRDLGPWTDLYALGVMAYEIVCGRRPFSGSNVHMLGHAHCFDPAPSLEPCFAVPDGTEQWVARLLEKEPHQRFPSAAAALRELPSAAAAAAGVPATWRSDHAWAPTAPPGLGLGLFAMREIPFVDRDEDRTSLWDGLRAAAEGRLQIHLLRGDSGVGKTRLARWHARRSLEVGAARVLVARHGRTLGPMHGLGPMIQEAVNGVGLEGEELRDRATRYTVAEAPRMPWVQALAAAIAEVAAPASAETPSVWFSRPAERHTAVGDWLRQVAHARPAILVLDDLHWGPETIEFLELLAERYQDLGVQVIATLRDDPAAGLTPSVAAALERLGVVATTTTLASLQRDDVVRLIQSVVGADEPLAAQVYELSAGRPLFAAQILAGWIDAEELTATAHGLQLASTALDDIPADVVALWRSRLDAILAGQEAGALLAIDAAAALGRSVDASEWRDLCGLLGIEPPAGIVDALSRAKLVTIDAHGWTFAHEGLHAHVCDVATRRDVWRDLNAACVELLERVPGVGPANRRAEHLRRAGRPEDAAALWFEIYDLLARTAVLQTAGRALADASAALDEAGIGPDDERRAKLLCLRARQHRQVSDFDEARAAAEAAHQLADEHGWIAIRAEANNILGGVISAASSDTHRAAAVLRDAIDDYTNVGDEGGVASAESDLAFVHLTRGELEVAADLAESACQTFRATGDHRFAQTLYYLGIIHSRSPALAQMARAELTQVVELCQRDGHRYTHASALNAIANLDRQSDELDAAAAAYRKVVELLEAIGADGAEVPWLNLAGIAVVQQQFDETSTIVERLLPKLEQKGAVKFRGFALGLLLPVAANDADGARFDDLFVEILDIVARTGLVSADLATPALVAARLWRAAGDDYRAARAARFARRQYKDARSEELAEDVATEFAAFDLD